MRLSFILLAHEPPDRLRPLIVSLLKSGSNVYVHYDAKSPNNLDRESRSWGLSQFDGQLYFAEREKVEWGDWSIVKATLNCLNLWRRSEDNCDYLKLISGSCWPIKPISLLLEHLGNNKLDYIEISNAAEKRWVTHGDQSKRWSHYSLFNWRRNPKLYALLDRIQEKLGVNRRLPMKHVPHLGAQWWCLRSTTVDSILDITNSNIKLQQFYKYTSIPDELFFQTIVANTVPIGEIASKSLTMYSFNGRGVAETRYNDSVVPIALSDKFFARKISAHAKFLREQLERIFNMDEGQFSKYCESLTAAHSSSYNRELKLINAAGDAAWHSFASSQFPGKKYCCSIPNRLLVICGGDWNRRRKLAEAFSHFDSVSSFGHIFHSEFIDFGDDLDRVAAYNKDHHVVARHHWQYFLGDICKYSGNNCVVFCIGGDADIYLETLKYKKGLAVVMLSQTGCDTLEGSGDIGTEKSHYLQQVKLEQTLNERMCQLHRLGENYSGTFLSNLVKNLQY